VCLKVFIVPHVRAFPFAGENLSMLEKLWRLLS